MESEAQVSDAPEGRHHHQLHVIVFAPRHPEPRTFVWDPALNVGAAAKQAAEAFGYAGGNPGLQTEGKVPRVLDNAKTLAEEHVHNDEKLELIDTGGGV